MITLLRYWQPILSSIITALLAFFVHQGVMAVYNLKHQAEIAELTQKMREECQKDKTITNEVSSDYQNALGNINNQFYQLIGLQPFPSGLSIANATSRYNDKAQQPEYANKDARAAKFYTFAREAEQYRIQLTACQDFVNKTWEVKAH